MAKPHAKKTKKQKPKDIELHPDAWERFEKGIKQIAKAKPGPVNKK